MLNRLLALTAAPPAAPSVAGTGDDRAWVGDAFALWNELSGPVRTSLLVVAAALGAWMLLRVGVLAATRPLPVRPAAPTQDLPGDEPPAVVSVLAGGWAVTEDAAESTLLDLAARGYLELRQPDADPMRTTVHVTAEDPHAAAAAAARQARVLRVSGGEIPLTDYEQQVLDHVKGIAVGGVVPLTALTFRDPGKAAEWAKRFESAVLADARGRGLVQRRVPVWTATMLSLAAVAPALAASWFAWEVSEHSDARWLAAGFVCWLYLSKVGTAAHGLRGTRRGRQVASAWFGVREYLEGDRAFAELPPSAVAVWDRYLAYGDALGVTHVASAVIDLGMANRRRVWSSYGGQWHQVQVRYPKPRSRYGAAAPGLIVMATLHVLAGYGLVQLARTVLPAVEDATGQVRSIGTPVVVGVGVAGVLVGLRGLYRFVRTLVDLGSARTLRGEVLWVAPWRTSTSDETTVTVVHYLAVDDGTDDRTTAWALPDGIIRGFGPGDVVELTARPWTRRVTALTVVQSRHVHPTGAAEAVALAAASPAARPVLGAPELAALLGVPLGAERPLPLPGAWMFPVAGTQGGAARGEVMLTVWDGRLQRTLFALHRRGEPVPGIGEEAYLLPTGAVARQGDAVVRLAVPAGLGVPRERVIAALGTVLARTGARTAGRVASTDGRPGGMPHGDLPAWPG